MFFVRRTIHFFRFAFIIVFKFFRDLQYRHGSTVLFERDLLANSQRLRDLAGYRQPNRDAPHQAVRQPHRFDDRIVIALAHKARQRRHRANGEHFQVRQVRGAERNFFQARGALYRGSAFCVAQHSIY
jgi:hypothetical protein